MAGRHYKSLNFVLYVAELPSRSFTLLAKQYGDIFGLNILGAFSLYFCRVVSLNQDGFM